jgi:hypothetical protein
VNAGVISADGLFAAHAAHRRAFAWRAVDLAVLAAVQTETSRSARRAVARARFFDLVRGFSGSFIDSWFAIPGFREAAIRTMTDRPGGAAQ